MIAAERRISGTQSGAVMWVTRTSPSLRSLPRLSSEMILTSPCPTPGAAPRPRTRASPSCSASSALSSPPDAVTGRDWSIQAMPSSSKAHSVSCGVP